MKLDSISNPILLALSAAVVTLWGCHYISEMDYDLSEFPATNITPEKGAYSFDQEGSFSVVEDSATGLLSVRFSRDGYRYDVIPVENGAFFHQHGQIGGTDCPTDGYGISGHFTAATVAEGQVAYAYDCRVTSRSGFIARR